MPPQPVPAPARSGPPACDWRLDLTARQRARLRTWFWSIAAATLAVLVIGGITRLTRSGLSIVEWRPVTGAIPPMTEAQWLAEFAEYQRFPEYQQLRQGMTLGEFKVIFFWEYLHRLVARLIGVVFLIPLAFFWRAGYLIRPVAIRALGLLGLGLLQGVMGWLMVRSGLIDRPSVSHYRLAAHLLIALAIFGAAVWFARELASAQTSATPAAPLRRLVCRGLAVIGVLLGLQILWGALVAGLRAGLFHNGFPLMGGQLLPPAGFALTPAAVNFVANGATVQWMHRLLGTLLLLVAVVLFVRLRRRGPDLLTWRLNVALLTLIAFQYALGVATLMLRVPVWLGVSHQAVAAAIVGVWVVWLHHAIDGGPPLRLESCNPDVTNPEPGTLNRVVEPCTLHLAP